MSLVNILAITYCLASSIYVSDLPIIQRWFWSTRKPVEQYHTIDEPVKLVIICKLFTSLIG